MAPNLALASIVQSNARKLAEMVPADGEIASLIAVEVEEKTAARIRPVYMWQGLMAELGEYLDSGPLVDSGPEGTNNPDRYVTKVTKKGVEKYGSYWADFAVDLGVCEKWVNRLRDLEAAGKADAPAELSHLTVKGPKWLEAEKRTAAEALRAAKELVITGVRIHQMVDRLNEHETIDVQLVTVKDGDGNDIIDEKTTRPFVLRERYVKRGQDGQPLTDSEGNPVYMHTDKIRYCTVGELIGLVPEEAATMQGGFSFENLMKAGAHKREREKKETGKKVSINNAEQFVNAIGMASDYITGDGYEKRITRLIDQARKDETVMESLMQFATAFDAIYEELKNDWHAAKQRRQAAKQHGNGNGTAKVA